MMRAIVGSSLRFRFIVVALAAGMMFFGITQLRAIPVDVFPEFAPPRVQIQTACLGLSAADVEQLVTVPLEDALNGIPGLDEMRSSSVPQLSSIELIFKQDTDESFKAGVALSAGWDGVSLLGGRGRPRSEEQGLGAGSPAAQLAP